ncbi:SEL1-like repeat protein (plasmid) [Leisingera sp. M527]|uniref:tetratricopeptide repeat protein n=1 Tax=Leisingera sp. M527 TaxID=2867014 RepID=UPI0021A5C328|nr:SEL1-like repeat protein [Leisingera sp. M527]UWQ35186.1 SEL1-like repeat protein [Leisingera sp. M527]
MSLRPFRLRPLAAALWLALPAAAAGQQALPLEQLRAEAAAGQAAAQYALALRLQDGRGVLQNYAGAADWLTRAAEQGHAAAQNRLGQSYHSGLGVAQDRAQALHWLEQAAASGRAQYLFDLAAVLEQAPDGSGAAQAAELYARAAGQGHQDAAVSLGVLYQNGTGVAQDPARARQLYEGPAAAGHPRALNNLGLMHVRGEGAAQDYARAAALFEAAAAQGLAPAIRNLGVMYENGFGVPLDEARAADLYRRAARAAGAAADPGLIYDARLAPPDSSAAGLERLTDGAAAGDPLAQFQLAWLALQQPDPPRAGLLAAVAQLRASAEAGYPAAMANLGWMYFEGRALPQDYVLGYMWLVLAASAGLPEARGLSAALQARLTPAQLAEAQELAAAKAGAGPQH